MKHGWMSKVAAVVVCGALGLMLAPGCDGLGLGGEGGGVCEGAGGYGGEGPVCNIVAQGPCYDLCQAEYDDSALQCGSISIEADRKTCQDDAYEAYKKCRTACDEDPEEECKKQCDKENEKCIAKCPKGDKGCMSKCNDVYAKCLKGCKGKK